MNFPTKEKLQDITKNNLEQQTEEDLKYINEYITHQAKKGCYEAFISQFPECKFMSSFHRRMRRCIPKLEEVGLEVKETDYVKNYVARKAYVISWR